MRLLDTDLAFAWFMATSLIVTIALVVLAVWLAWLLWPRRDEINYRSDRIRANIWKPK